MRVNPIDTQASREGPETRCAARTYEGVSLGTVKVRSEPVKYSGASERVLQTAPI